MALKDWKKTLNEKNEVEFINKKKPYLKVVLERERDQYNRGFIWINNIDSHIDHSTKAESIAYAKKWMRKH